MMASSEVDVLNSSSFTSLIQREQSDEIIHIDIHSACLIGDVETLQGKRDLINQSFGLDQSLFLALQVLANLNRA